MDRYCNEVLQVRTYKELYNALNPVKYIKKFCNKAELLQLITSNFYSILCYNSEIWHLPSLNNSLKAKLMSASAKAIKVCMYYPDPMISFERIHAINHRATHNAIMKYYQKGI